MALLMHAIHESTGRIPRPLMDRLFYKIPYLGDLVAATGGIEGNRTSARTLLDKNEIVMVAPGGMQEALRPSSERYQIRWDKRKGFAQIAIETGAHVVLAVCPKADDLYEVYPNRVTSWAYQTFKIPVFLARGIGYTPIPRPVQLTHFLSEPIVPPHPAGTPDALNRQISRFHRQLIARAQELIGDAVRYRPGQLGVSARF
jgi:1-acyl-sn-glycerol-3-phosphate acyltransferase